MTQPTQWDITWDSKHKKFAEDMSLLGRTNVFLLQQEAIVRTWN